MATFKLWILVQLPQFRRISIHSESTDLVSNLCVPFMAETLSFPFHRVQLIPTWYTYQDNHPGFMATGVTSWALQMYSDGGNGAAGAAMVSINGKQYHESVVC